jgi:hypothetical protein
VDWPLLVVAVVVLLVLDVVEGLLGVGRLGAGRGGEERVRPCG